MVALLQVMGIDVEVINLNQGAKRELLGYLLESIYHATTHLADYVD